MSKKFLLWQSLKYLIAVHSGFSKASVDLTTQDKFDVKLLVHLNHNENDHDGIDYFMQKMKHILYAQQFLIEVKTKLL